MKEAQSHDLKEGNLILEIILSFIKLLQDNTKMHTQNTNFKILFCYVYVGPLPGANILFSRWLICMCKILGVRCQYIDP